jgi:hypothetical protein
MVEGGPKTMANNLYKVITRDEAIPMFDSFVLPNVIAQFEQDGDFDEIARSETWNNWTDMLREEKRISDWQYENWTHPKSCEG